MLLKPVAICRCSDVDLTHRRLSTIRCRKVLFLSGKEMPHFWQLGSINTWPQWTVFSQILIHNLSLFLFVNVGLSGRFILSFFLLPKKIQVYFSLKLLRWTLIAKITRWQNRFYHWSLTANVNVSFWLTWPFSVQSKRWSELLHCVIRLSVKAFLLFLNFDDAIYTTNKRIRVWYTVLNVTCIV